MRVKIIKIGNSQGIRIPKVLLRQTGIQDEVDLEVEDNQITIRPIDHKTRAGWRSAYKNMSENKDDILLDEHNLNYQSSFDVEDWEKVKNDEYWQKRFDFYNKKMMIQKQNIQKLCHITGTIGIFPWFDAKAGYVKLYFIKSKYITDVYTNPDTQELTGIKTEINYQFAWEDGKEYWFTEKKIYMKTKIITTKRLYLLPFEVILLSYSLLLHVL